MVAVRASCGGQTTAAWLEGAKSTRNAAVRKLSDKATFIKNATAGKSKFVLLEYKDPSIRVVGDVAIVRFHWVAESESIADGKKSSTNLHILMNWQKQGWDWKLLSRASTKL